MTWCNVCLNFIDAFRQVLSKLGSYHVQEVFWSLLFYIPFILQILFVCLFVCSGLRSRSTLSVISRRCLVVTGSLIKAGNVVRGNRKVMQSECSREHPNMIYGIRQNVNSQVSFHELYFYTVLQLYINKKENTIPLVFMSASETHDSGPQTSSDYLRSTFSYV